MKAVILAGGLGTRLSEETHSVPKPMVEIGGRPILWHIMKIYASHGINDFVICLGYKGHIIKEFFNNYKMNMSDVTIDLKSGEVDYHDVRAEDWRVTLVETGEMTLTGGRLKRVRHLLDDTFLMTYGDGVSDIDIGASIDFHKKMGLKATVSAVTPPGRFGLLDINSSKVDGFVEKPRGDGGRVNGGYFVLEPSALDYVDGDDTMWEEAPMHNLVADGQLAAYQHDGFWQPMDTMRDKAMLRSLWDKGANIPWKSW
jgi:glucose-1-phosphate cytidylyltransferase